MGQVTDRLYECDVCHKKGAWGKGWMHRIILHDHWDELVVICSDDCAIKWQEEHPKD